MIKFITPVLDHQLLTNIQKEPAKIRVSEALPNYIQAKLVFTRTTQHFNFGLSPRGGIALLNAAKAWALIDGKDFVIPEHVKAVLPSVVNHRLIITSDEINSKNKLASDLIEESIPIS